MALRVIAGATLVVVVGTGILFRIFDGTEYPDIWTGMWFALQTVTTVGYGDVTPSGAAGKLLASLVMLEGTAFLAIITAAITSTFVARAERERRAADADAGESRIDARFDDLAERLDRLERLTQRLVGNAPDQPRE